MELKMKNSVFDISFDKNNGSISSIKNTMIYMK